VPKQRPSSLIGIDVSTAGADFAPDSASTATARIVTDDSQGAKTLRMPALGLLLARRVQALHTAGSTTTSRRPARR